MNQPNNAREENNQPDRRKFLKASSAFLAVAGLAAASATEVSAETSSTSNSQTSNTPNAPTAVQQRSWGAGWMTF